MYKDGTLKNEPVLYKSERMIPKNFFHFISVIALTLPAPARATYYAVSFSKDFLVVAIDSRATNLFDPSAPPNDRYCKLYPLSDKVVFFSTGYVAGNAPGISFDAGVFAKGVYARSPIPPNLADLTDKWDDFMHDAYMRLFSSYPSLAVSLGNRVMIKGYFGGISDDEKVVLESSEMSSLFGRIRSQLLHQQQAGNGTPIVHGGHNEIISEFINRGSTERAKKVLAEIDVEATGKSDLERMAITVEAFVKSVRDWSGDSGIGGEVAVLILERGKSARWFRRPAHCPEK
jgi:hypothetical protein